jgi:hypothetical protein
MSIAREGLDFRTPEYAAKQMPHDIDAEQSVIGMALYVNDSVDRADGLLADHFYEPAHGRIWGAVAALVARGSSADPVTVAAKLEGDAALAELGGIAYLAELFERAPPAINMRDHARVIIDRALRREMIVYSEGTGAAARNAEVEAARWIKAHCKKPVAGFIAGATAPAGRRMGHAGAIVGGHEDTAEAKIAVFKECGIEVAATPSDMADALLRAAKAKGVSLS